jgi:hypothetical protein
MAEEAPSVETKESAEDWPVGWDAHRRDQIVFIARNTTPAQRFKWLMDMLELLRPQLPELLRNRELVEAERRGGGGPPPPPPPRR